MVPEPELTQPPANPGPPTPPQPAPYGPFVPAPPTGAWAYGPQPGQYAPPFPPAPAKPSVLPVEPRAFHEFYRAPAFRWWKPLVSVVIAVIAWGVLGVMVMFPFILVDVSQGTLTIDQLASGKYPITPMIFLGNNLGIVTLIPIALVTHRIAFGQRAGYLCSIQGRFRWRLFGRFVLFALPVFALGIGWDIFANGLPDLAWTPHSLSMILIILLTTPLQSAGEEFGLRGFLPRAIGSYFKAPWLGWAVATVISSIVFMLIHGAGDPYLNTFYFCFAVLGSLLVWRTGGLEAAIALHVVNNVFGLAFVPFEDMSGIFDRQAGVGSPIDLVQLVFLAGTLALFWWQAGRQGVPNTAAPGRVGADAPGAGPVPQPGFVPAQLPGQVPPAPWEWNAGQGFDGGRPPSQSDK